MRGILSTRRVNRRTPTYGVFVLYAAATISLPAQTFTALLSFNGEDGAYPQAVLVQGTDGNFYGTTYGGGARRKGTIFKITPAGVPTTLYSFCAQGSCGAGEQPWAGLVQGRGGDFFGATPQAIFKITPSGALTTLYNFSNVDNAQPAAGLVQATSGDFYGTSYAEQTVFKITPSGALTTLYTFCHQRQCHDGQSPAAGLVQGTDGDFYGTTEFGGINNGGTIFKITPDGTLTTLYTFCQDVNCADGAHPFGGLTQAIDGDFYGTTVGGGAFPICLNGCGTVFKVTAAGSLTTLYSFCAETACVDGFLPEGALVQATDGNFYGTTEGGGTTGNGTIFKIESSGMLTTLYSFCSQNNCTDGGNPFAGLVQATNGDFFGTTCHFGAYGGNDGFGTVFSFSTGLGPFVETQPSSGTVGTAVKILGTNLAGVSSVTFNGTPATFAIS